MPGTRWDEKYRTWWCPLSWAHCVALRGVFGDDLWVGDALNAWAAPEAERANRCIALRLAKDAEGDERLDPGQRVGAKFMAEARRALEGDGCGAGKGVMTPVAIQELGDEAYPCLVICTNSMLYKWRAELEVWAPGRTVSIVTGTAAKRRKALEPGYDVYIINWQNVASHTRLAGFGDIRLDEKDKEPKELNKLGLKTVVADEAHYARTPKSKMTRGWWWLSAHAENSLALTGTSVEKSPEDLWCIMHGVCPEEWPSKTAWIDRYCIQSWNAFGGRSVTGLRPDTSDELFKYLDARFIRRPTEVVCPDIAQKLPPQVRYIDMPTKQAKAYESMRKEMLAELDSGILLATSPLAKLGRMKQLASAYAEIDEEGGVHLSEPSNKLEALYDVLEEFDGQQLVVFTESKELLMLACARLSAKKKGWPEIPFGVIAGEITNPLQRAQTEKAFQDGDLRLIIATMAAGGEGLTLTASNRPIFLQESFENRLNKQAVDRTWRRGQTMEVQPIIFRTLGTVDERVAGVIGEKDLMAEEIYRDQATIRALLS